MRVIIVDPVAPFQEKPYALDEKTVNKISDLLSKKGARKDEMSFLEGKMDVRPKMAYFLL